MDRERLDRQDRLVVVRRKLGDLIDVRMTRALTPAERARYAALGTLEAVLLGHPESHGGPECYEGARFDAGASSAVEPS